MDFYAKAVNRPSEQRASVRTALRQSSGGSGRPARRGQVVLAHPDRPDGPRGQLVSEANWPVNAGDRVWKSRKIVSFLFRTSVLMPDHSGCGLG